MLTIVQEEYGKAAMNRPALGSFPPKQWAEWLNTGLMKVAPKGLDQLVTTLCGSSANETAFKAAFMAYRQRERGSRDAPFTQQELGECECGVPWGRTLCVYTR